MSKIVAAGAATSAMLLAGCAKGATIKSTIGQSSPFCADVATFAVEAVPRNNAAGDSRHALLHSLPPVETLLVKLQGEAPSADPVNGKPLKADVGTIAATYTD